MSKKKAAKPAFKLDANSVVRSIAEIFSDMDGDKAELIKVLDVAKAAGVDFKKIAHVLRMEMQQDVGWTFEDAKVMGPLLKRYGVKTFKVTFTIDEDFEF